MFGKCETFSVERSTKLKEIMDAPNNKIHIISDNVIKKRIYLDIVINNRECKGLLDTGATSSVLGKNSEWIWKNLCGVNILKDETVIAANGHYMNCHGKVKIKIKHKDQEKWIKMLIVPEVVEQIILGINFFHLFNMNISYEKNEMVNVIKNGENGNEAVNTNDVKLTTEQEERLKQAIGKFLFSTDTFVGCQSRIKHNIDTGNHKPICQRLYQYSPDVEEQIKKEIDRWLKLGYIEPANTDWRHPIVPVTKKMEKSDYVWMRVN